MDSAAPPHQRRRPNGVINIIAITFCLCCIFVILSLFVLDHLARNSVQTHNNEIDLSGLDGRSTAVHSSLSLSSHNNTSDVVSTITTDISNRRPNDDDFLFSSIPNLTKTLSHKPSRYTDGLEFIHITKTAGSSIEAAAAHAGIKFGACHWLKLEHVLGPGCNDPDKGWDLELNKTRTPYQWKGSRPIEHWHTPWHWFRDDHNPYQNKSLFTVVRNPYERLVSEFFFSCKSTKYALLCFDATSETMNNFIRTRSWACLHGERCMGHFLPQYVYIYDMEGNQVIDHVLRLEHLNEDFSALMTLYNLPIGRLGKMNVRNNTVHTGASGTLNLTVANLTKKTIEVINKVYDRDFALLNYPKVASPDDFL